jgi:hypothetical protein
MMQWDDVLAWSSYRSGSEQSDFGASSELQHLFTQRQTLHSQSADAELSLEQWQQLHLEVHGTGKGRCSICTHAGDGTRSGCRHVSQVKRCAAPIYRSSSVIPNQRQLGQTKTPAHTSVPSTINRAGASSSDGTWVDCQKYQQGFVSWIERMLAKCFRVGTTSKWVLPETGKVGGGE